MAITRTKKARQKECHSPTRILECSEHVLVQRHASVAGTVVDIVSLRVPLTMDWLRAAGIDVSENAQKQTCRAVFRSLCNDIDFRSELMAHHQRPSSELIYSYVDKHLQGIVDRALRPPSEPQERRSGAMA